MSSAAQLKAGDVQSRWLTPALITASLLVFLNVLSLTRYRNFFYDEWSFIVSRRT